jgi:deoxyribodipyrimidine photo-lyase
MTSLLWLRLDLRLADNPALHAALKRNRPVVAVFIHSPEEEAPWEPGGASRWWLHQSLAAVDAELRARGSRLVIRRGPSLEVLRGLIKETGANELFWNRRYEPAIIARDQKIKAVLRTQGLEVESFNGALLHEPWTVQNQSGEPFRVFTRFWKYCLTKPDAADPLPTPRRLIAPQSWPESLPLNALELEPKINWAEGIRDVWKPGTAGAHAQLKRFLPEAVGKYSSDRNRPDLLGTSRLSPHLHFGEITPRQIWHVVRRQAERNSVRDWRSSQFLTELGWREFSHHLLYHFPLTSIEPMRAEFKEFPWRADQRQLKAWQEGRTGFPIVDAGMRELWTVGWMHNRVRMIVASFLVKDLLIPWQDGARWFWDTLVDADLAQNTLGWQWTAGCGADAAPYFRIFNPVSQGAKFDPDGAYVRRWCPELAKLPNEWIHQPWAVPSSALAHAGVKLGRDYPEPIVNHRCAREVALGAFAKIKERRRVSRA